MFICLSAWNNSQFIASVLSLWFCGIALSNESPSLKENVAWSNSLFIARFTDTHYTAVGCDLPDLLLFYLIATDKVLTDRHGAIWGCYFFGSSIKIPLFSSWVQSWENTEIIQRGNKFPNHYIACCLQDGVYVSHKKSPFPQIKRSTDTSYGSLAMLRRGLFVM